MIETPAVAFRQSSSDRRSPMTNSTFWRCTSPSSFFRRSSLLEGRTKQRRLAKPYSRSFSTTFEPIKPLDPVTRMHSFGKAMDLRFTMLQSGRQASGAGPASAKAMTDRSNEQIYFKERLEGCWEAADHESVGAGRCKADNRVPNHRPSKHRARPYLCFRSRWQHLSPNRRCRGDLL